MTTIAYGNHHVEVTERPQWRPIQRCPFKSLRGLTPDTTWFDLKPMKPDSMWETHVLQPSGHALPPGVLAAQEFLNCGARHAYVVEAWDGPNGVMRADLHGANVDEPIHGLIQQFLAVSEGRLGGFPDVVAFWDDGRITLQELKLCGKDHIKSNQHATADRLRECLGDRLDLRILVWGQGWP